MNSLSTSADESPFFESAFQRASYPTLTKLSSTLALLILAYYAVSFLDAWPSTIKRSVYESLIYFVPSAVIYAIQQGMVYSGRLGLEDAKFTRADFGDTHAKQQAIQRIFGQPQLPFALRKVRSLSGVGKYISLSDEIRPAGLGNWDNSCYQNSILQGLASLPAFFEYVARSLEQCELYGPLADTHRALLGLFEQLTDLNPRKTTVWTPNVLKSMDSWQQQDAQEYFTRLLEALEKESDAYIRVRKRRSVPGLESLDAVSTSRNPRPASEIAPDPDPDLSLIQLVPRNPLDGMTAQCLECRTCGFTEGFSFNQFNCLTLNMGRRGPSDLEDLLDEYTMPEDIDGVECENCTKLAHGGAEGDDESEQSAKETAKRKPVLRTKTKQITVGRSPRDLILHINRSVFDDYGNQMKNRAALAVPLKLSFLSRWCAPIVRSDASVQRVYELKCMVTHYGRHDNGHYVALGQRGKDWYSFNDDFVTKIDEEEVLNTGNGFMLFYEAVPLEPQVEDTLNPAEGSAVVENGTASVEIGSGDDKPENAATWSHPDSNSDEQDSVSMHDSSAETSPGSAHPSSAASELSVDDLAKRKGLNNPFPMSTSCSSAMGGGT
ncbi:hypothetical protein ABEF95_010016 [Exophiala dermatitidis]